MASKTSNLKFGIVLGDVHAPYHSVAAVNLACKVIKDTRPDYVISIGDLTDGMALMSHIKSSEQHAVTWKQETTKANKLLDQLQAACAKNTKFIWVGGNHDNSRLDRYVAKICPELDGMLDFATVFKVKERGWTYIPYGEVFKLGKMNFIHDMDAAGGNAHRQAERDFCGNVCIGHTHRSALEVFGFADGRSHVAMMAGWLGNPKAATYMKTQKKVRYWTHSINSFWLEPNGCLHPYIHPMVNGRVVVNGKLYR